jgi:hypothetical protein
LPAIVVSPLVAIATAYNHFFYLMVDSGQIQKDLA